MQSLLSSLGWPRSCYMSSWTSPHAGGIGYVFTLSQADTVPESVPLGSSAYSANQSFRDSAAATKACPHLGCGWRSVVVVEGPDNKQTRLIIYCNQYT